MKELEYKLLDCGFESKLEKFGEISVERPAPQAEYKSILSDEEWDKADLVFDPNELIWINQKNIPNEWILSFDKIAIQLKTTPSGQVGIFPEQLPNWEWTYEKIKEHQGEISILNGFAYTGVATLFAAMGKTPHNEVKITHIDATKSVVNWAKKNYDLSKIDEDVNVSWVVEDILTYLQREVKRGKTYDAFILDPPAFGRGKGKKTWKLKRDLPLLIDLVGQLLSKNPKFIILSCHDPEIDEVALKRALTELKRIRTSGTIESFDLDIKAESGAELHSGICVRWTK